MPEPLRRARTLLGMAAAATLVLAIPVRAQGTGSQAEGLRVGIALSGGSAKGFAHVGVLRVLEEAGVRIDAVAGTSMGAVVGGLYASGLSVDSIAQIIATADWDVVLADGAERDRRFLHQRRFDERSVLNLPVDGGGVSLAAGATDGSNVMRLAERTTWPVATVRSFADLPRPFTAVATDIETGEAVALTQGVLSEAMRASVGIPGAFEPFALDGRLLVDGAVARNLPAADVRALGVDFVICSDVSDDLAQGEDLESIVDVLGQVLTLSMVRSNEEQRRLCDIVVRPDTEGLSSRAWNEHEQWFTRGASAAELYRDDIRAVAEGQGPRPEPLRAPIESLGDSVRVDFVQVEGATRAQTLELVREEIGVVEGEYVSAEALSSRLSDLDATGLFGLVRYRLDRVPGGIALTLHVEEQPRDRVGVGLRYDDERRAALLFTTTIHNLVRYGSISRFELRVGEETRILLSYLRRHSVTGRVEGGTTLAWSQGTLLLGDSTRVETGIEITSLSTGLGFVFGRSTSLGVELLGERTVSDDALLPDVLLASASLVLDHESLDQLDFPRSGIDATVRWEYGVTDIQDAGSFTVGTATGTAFLPLHDRWSLEFGGFAGSASGADLPTHRLFFVGGAHPSAIFTMSQPLFQGVASEQLMGQAAQVGRLALRWRAPRGVHLRAGVDIGGAMPAWKFPIDDPVVGWALAAGVSTPLGPAVLQWARASDGFGDQLTVRVGRRF